MDWKIVFDETAVRRLVERAQVERMTINDFCAHLFKDYQFGLNLVKKTPARRSLLLTLRLSMLRTNF
jgi:hypothetical protein